MKRWMELGRSMVEMLGVLTVVGVLTILGMYGYRRAMNKIHANEIMDLALKAYNENLSYGVLNPDPASYAECKAYTKKISSTPAAARILDWDSPAGTQENFSIWVSYCNSGLATNAYHLIFLNYMNQEDCIELKSMTEANGTSHFRLIPNSKVPGLPNGIRVYCSKNDSTANANQWW